MKTVVCLNKHKECPKKLLPIISKDKAPLLSAKDCRCYSTTPNHKLLTKVPEISIKDLIKNKEFSKRKPEVHILYSPTLIKVSDRSKYLIYKKAQSSSPIKLPKSYWTGKKISFSQFLFSSKSKF